MIYLVLKRAFIERDPKSRVPFFYYFIIFGKIFGAMKFTSMLMLFWGITFSAFAQGRYLAPITDEIVTETHTYTSKDGQNLDMDIYMPVNDPEIERPVIMYIHGGGFQGGERDHEKNVKFCSRLAKLGYVTASISYRLTRKGKEGGFGCNCPATEKLNTFHAAMEDIQDATYYLIQNRHQFEIDPQKIILAGSSAGAEAALITAYQPPFCYGLESGPVDYAGVIGMAGAIPDTSIIFEDSAVPSLLFHGTSDNLVPYASAPHHYCKPNAPGYIILHGSHTIAKKLVKLEIPHWLHTTCGGGHEMASNPMSDYFDEIVNFCFNFVLSGTAENRHTVVQGIQQKPEYEQFNFCEQ